MAARKPTRADFSAEFLREALHYDPETGVFTWRLRPDHPQKWNTRYAGTIAGFVHKDPRSPTDQKRAYITIQIKGRVGYIAHRLAWLYMTSEWPPDQIDHIDGNRMNNVWTNLRLATNSQNNQNRGAQSNNRCGLRGISLHPTAGYRVRLTVNGVTHDLGYFSDKDEAIAARKELEEKFHGDFAPKS